MLVRHVTRSSQPVTTKGMGRHFTSPRKVRDKKKTWITASVPGHASKRQKLLDELGNLLTAPSYFISKRQVDAVGRHIDHARHHPSKMSQSGVPDEAIDQCEASYEAADGQKQKTAMENFDDTGLMALICRHDIPLFFANIDMPGEQQKYSVALIRHLFTLLPFQATVVVLYDVGCVLARSLSRVSFSNHHSLL